MRIIIYFGLPDRIAVFFILNIDYSNISFRPQFFFKVIQLIIDPKKTYLRFIYFDHVIKMYTVQLYKEPPKMQ